MSVPRSTTDPERTGTRHLTGPYVDYLCTDDYTVTVTTPVTLDGEMVETAPAATLPLAQLYQLF